MPRLLFKALPKDSLVKITFEPPPPFPLIIKQIETKMEIL